MEEPKRIKFEMQKWVFVVLICIASLIRVYPRIGFGYALRLGGDALALLCVSLPHHCSAIPFLRWTGKMFQIK